MSYLKESDIEKTLVKKVKAINGLCIKLTSPSMAGLPDRMIFLPNGRFAFVELKANGKKARPLQVKRMNDFRKFGFKCYVIDDVKQINGVLDLIKGGDAN